MKHLSDQELMRIVQAGDPSPASEIYDRYSTKIYNLAYRFLRNAQLAEDATQDVFVKMLKHANSFNNDARLLTWLFTITANWCRDHMRRSENRNRASVEVLDELAAPVERFDPYRVLERNEAERRVARALDKLKFDQRQAVVLSRYEGLSYAEIAKIAGCSEGAVKTRVFRAMEVLKTALIEEQEARQRGRGGDDEGEEAGEGESHPEVTNA